MIDAYSVLPSTLLNTFLFFCSEKIVTEDIPANLNELALEKRHELVELVSEVDDQLAEAFLSDEPISAAELEVYFFKICNRFLFYFLFSVLGTFLIAKAIFWC